MQARRNVRPQSCQSAFSSFSGVAGGQRFIFIFLGELVGIRLYPRCCRGSVICNSLISGAHLLKILQAICRKTTTSLPQVKVTEVLLWSSPEIALRETKLKMCSLWYDF